MKCLNLPKKRSEGRHDVLVEERIQIQKRGRSLATKTKWYLLYCFLLASAVAGCRLTALKSRPEAGVETPVGKPITKVPIAEFSATGRVRFVQLTNLHLFDAGHGQHGERVFEEALDNRSSLHWAVLEINQLVRTEPGSIDFVVITGDFGLENVTMPKAKNCQCPTPRPRDKEDEGPIEAVPLADAAAEVAREFNALLVKRIFVVPGEKDLCRGSRYDRHRWVDFVDEVNIQVCEQYKSHIQNLTGVRPNNCLSPDLDAPPPPVVSDLTHSKEVLSKIEEPSIKINDIRLLAFNNAHFFPTSKQVQKDIDQQKLEELDRLAHQIQQGGTYLVFTHFPDLHDAALYGPDQDQGSLSGDRWSSSFSKLNSDLEKRISRDQAADQDHSENGWLRLLSQRRFIGLFAGHVESNRREIYPKGFGVAVDKTDRWTAKKTWIAPPLGVEYQNLQPSRQSARGLLLVTATTDGAVDARPIWFETVDPDALAKDDATLAEAQMDELGGDWEAAVAKYASAMSSTDARARATATLGYERARAVIDHWYYYPENWILVHRFGLISIGGVALLLIAVRLMSRSIRIVKPQQITKDVPVDSFGPALLLALLDINRYVDQLFEREGEKFQAGGNEIMTFLVTLPRRTFVKAVSLDSFDSFPSVLDSLPAIQGIDPKGFALFFWNIWQYLGWRVESGLSVTNVDGELSGVAMYRRAWRTRSSWRLSASFPPPGQGVVPDLQEPLQTLARRLALQIFAVRALNLR
jgi:hypothetical protein